MLRAHSAGFLDQPPRQFQSAWQPLEPLDDRRISFERGRTASPKDALPDVSEQALRERLTRALQKRDVMAAERLVQSGGLSRTDPLFKEAISSLKKWAPVHQSCSRSMADTKRHALDEMQRMMQKWPFSHEDLSYRQAAVKVHKVKEVHQNLNSGRALVTDLQELHDEWPFARTGQVYQTVEKTRRLWDEHCHDLDVAIGSKNPPDLKRLVESSPLSRDDEVYCSAKEELEECWQLYMQDVAQVANAAELRDVASLHSRLNSWAWDMRCEDYRRYKKKLSKLWPSYTNSCEGLEEATVELHVPRLRELVTGWSFFREDYHLERAEAQLAKWHEPYEAQREKLCRALDEMNVSLLQDAVACWTFSKQDDIFVEASDELSEVWPRYTSNCEGLVAVTRERHVPRLRELVETWAFYSEDQAVCRARDQLEEWREPYEEQCLKFRRAAKEKNIPLLQGTLQEWRFSEQDDAYQLAQQQLSELWPGYSECCKGLEQSIEELHPQRLRQLVNAWPYSREVPALRKAKGQLDEWRPLYEEQCKGLRTAMGDKHIPLLQSLLSGWKFSYNDTKYQEVKQHLVEVTPRYTKACRALDDTIDERLVPRLAKLVEVWPYCAEDPALQRAERQLNEWKPVYEEQCRTYDAAMADKNIPLLLQTLGAWQFSQRDSANEKAKQHLADFQPSYKNSCKGLDEAMNERNVLKLRGRTEAWDFFGGDKTLQKAKAKLAEWEPSYEEQRKSFRDAMEEKNVPLLQSALSGWQFSQQDEAFQVANQHLAEVRPGYTSACDGLREAISEKHVTWLIERLQGWAFWREDPVVQGATAKLDEWRQPHADLRQSIRTAIETMNIPLLKDSLSNWKFSEKETAHKEAKEQFGRLVPKYHFSCEAVAAAIRDRNVPRLHELVDTWTFFGEDPVAQDARAKLAEWKEQHTEECGKLRAAAESATDPKLIEKVNSLLAQLQSFPFSKDDEAWKDATSTHAKRLDEYAAICQEAVQQGDVVQLQSLMEAAPKDPDRRLKAAGQQLSSWLPDHKTRCERLSSAVEEKGVMQLHKDVQSWPFSKKDAAFAEARKQLQPMLPAYLLWCSAVDSAIAEAKDEMYQNFGQQEEPEDGAEADILDLPSKCDRDAWEQIKASLRPDALMICFDTSFDEVLREEGKFAKELLAALVLLDPGKVDAEVVSPLAVKLYKGSGTLAVVEGPTDNVELVRGLTLTELEVLGHRPEVVVSRPLPVPASDALGVPMPGRERLQQLLAKYPFKKDEDVYQRAMWIDKYVNIKSTSDVGEFFSPLAGMPRTVMEDADVRWLKTRYDKNNTNAFYMLELSVQVKRVTQLLKDAEHNPALRESAEVLSITSMCARYKEVVKALCGTPSQESKHEGVCQLCGKPVDAFPQGLPCGEGAQRICWMCLVNHIDEEKFIEMRLSGDQEDAKADETPKAQPPSSESLKAEDPQRRVAQRRGVLLSGRLDGGKKEQAVRETAKALKDMGVPVLIAPTSVGGDFGRQTLRCLRSMEMMVAFAFEDYGEKTAGRYCTYYEVEYASNHEIPIIPLKLYDGQWPPAPVSKPTKQKDEAGAQQNASVFKSSLAHQEFGVKEAFDAGACAHFIAARYREHAQLASAASGTAGASSPSATGTAGDAAGSAGTAGSS